MSRYWSGLIGAVMVLIWAELPLPAQTKAPIEIGAFLPLTGKFALPGDQQKKGILAATHDINAAGGINGRLVKLDIEDTSDSNTTAITAVQKLVEKPYPALLGTVLGTQMLAVMPVIKQSQVPTVTTSGTRKVTQQGNPWIFRVTPHDGISKPALVKFGADALHIKKRPFFMVPMNTARAAETFICRR